MPDIRCIILGLGMRLKILPVCPCTCCSMCGQCPIQLAFSELNKVVVLKGLGRGWAPGIVHIYVHCFKCWTVHCALFKSGAEGRGGCI